jgi:hypothetical protein
MKTKINSILIFFCIGIFVLSCTKEKENKQLDFSGKLISHSSCKSGLKSTLESLNTSDSLSCIEWVFEDSTNKLSIKHVNAGFNCGYDSLYCGISLSGDTIMVQEHETSNGANCDCLFDLDFEISGIANKKYQIRFIEPYRYDQAELSFEMDLINEKEGSFCVTRKLYPWGMESTIR